MCLADIDSGGVCGATRAGHGMAVLLHIDGAYIHTEELHLNAHTQNDVSRSVLHLRCFALEDATVQYTLSLTEVEAICNSTADPAFHLFDTGLK